MVLVYSVSSWACLEYLRRQVLKSCPSGALVLQGVPAFLLSALFSAILLIQLRGAKSVDHRRRDVMQKLEP